MNPVERATFLDELPEGAWRQIVKELADSKYSQVSAEESGSTVVEGAGETNQFAAPVRAIIEARRVEKGFNRPGGGRIQVIAPITLSVEPGVIVALLGPSGSGKSTLLRMLSGLTAPTSGEVFWHGRPLREARPNAAIVFQSFALFPWLRSNGVDRSAVLRNIIGAIEMETNQDWMAKYSTAASRAKVEARRSLWSPELQELVSGQWNELIAEVEAALEENPASRKVQALAARWRGLVEDFTGRDRDIEESVGKMWADLENWPADMQQKAPVIKPEVWAFIARANAASG
jgi:ABC-type uncharacterized transport system YnjBCD ATPase subunit